MATHSTEQTSEQSRSLAKNSLLFWILFQVNLCRTCVLLSAKAPEKSEPVLADKEIIMAALNIRSMDFGGSFAKV